MSNNGEGIQEQNLEHKMSPIRGKKEKKDVLALAGERSVDTQTVKNTELDEQHSAGSTRMCSLSLTLG